MNVDYMPLFITLDGIYKDDDEYASMLLKELRQAIVEADLKPVERDIVRLILKEHPTHNKSRNDNI